MTSIHQWKARPLSGGIFSYESLAAADPNRPPVVLLHGAGANALTWTGVAGAFAGHRVLLVDMPGHGLSDAPADWDIHAVAARVADAVRPWTRGTAAIWGGHSWGGKTAGLLAAGDPTQCRGLALFDPSPSAAVPIDIEGFVDSIWSDEMRSHATIDDALAASRSQRHWQPWNDDVAAACRHGLAQREDGSWSLRPTREDLIALATATLLVDENDALAHVASVPTLLMIAEESAPWQQMTNVLTYPHATQTTIPGHHWIQISAHDPVLAALAEWLPSIVA